MNLLKTVQNLTPNPPNPNNEPSTGRYGQEPEVVHPLRHRRQTDRAVRARGHGGAQVPHLAARHLRPVRELHYVAHNREHAAANAQGASHNLSRLTSHFDSTGTILRGINGGQGSGIIPVFC